ncbi:hypothetical protein [Penaeicola halotolerans]|uniref:hypothetical protein n=1 Tax=Penaeicola halotolerans TaxID=2793196 RepID=UPI001CF9159B|nr:hypothetical protein [Penaeicola halotolerans]
MKKLIFACLISMLAFACQNSSDEKSNTDGAFDPQLVLTDSVQIDYLGSLRIMDIHPESGNILLYDTERRSFVLVNQSGDILKERTFQNDERDSFGTYLYAANFYKNDIMVTSYLGLILYDQELNLKEKKVFDRSIVGTQLGGAGSPSVYGSYFFNTSVESERRSEVYSKENFLVEEKILHLLDLDKMETIANTTIPQNTYMAQLKGKFEYMSPSHLFDGDQLYVLFPHSPEIYTYDLSRGMTLIDTVSFPPLEKYVPIQKPKPDNFGTYYADLAASKFTGLARSNDHWVAIYIGAIPQADVDGLPRNIIDDRFWALYLEYKKTYAAIISDAGAVKEITAPFEVVRNKLYLNTKLEDVDKEEVESDFVTFYFYEVAG